MNFPFVIEIASKKILLHAVFEILAFFIGFRYFLYLRKRQGDVIESPKRVWIFIGAIFGSLIGSRLVGGLEDPSQILKADNIIVYFYFNKTVLGGFLGGLLGVEFVKKMIGETKASGDLFTYPILLALIIGRIGCFSMGVYEETYGTETTFFTGMNLGDGLMRHPVMLYEMFFLAMLWFSIAQINKKYALANGVKFKLFLIAYCFFRLLSDFIKPHYVLPIGISTIQLTSLFGLTWYYRYILNPKKFLITSTPDYAS